MKTLCIYHGNCADGFGAAWVVRKAFKELYDNAEIEFYPAKYQEPPPDVAGLNVIMVDFSYKIHVVANMLEKCNNMLIIDHHASAIDNLVPLRNDVKLTKFMQLEHSGAMLAWMWFFTKQEPPQLIKHIEDRDLWKFSFLRTREIQANLFSFPYDFDLWDGLMKMEGSVLHHFASQGEAIERKHFKDIDEFILVATRDMLIDGVVMPVCNCPYMWGSDAAHKLAKIQQDKGLPPVAGYYYDTSDGRIFGLRSIGDFDCAAIASKFGGGGHKNAAGFKISPFVADDLEHNSVWSSH